jgi:hypothetical protein
MGAQPRPDEVIITARRFLTSPDIGYSATRAGAVLWSWVSRVRRAPRSHKSPRLATEGGIGHAWRCVGGVRTSIVRAADQGSSDCRSLLDHA